ncbi:MAG: hypothetical protein GWN00_34060 [Aliifodinibius sp.]|nr:hypothetical protein [Fodinibius sp.]NIV14718.1 hypothetical protein [Fodinibius sp.]NIY29629.1 hypothetical protein [Fodinibius sp.]
MSSLIDIIGSSVIGGFLLLLLFNVLNTTNEYFLSHGDDLIVQKNLTSVASILEHDLRKMGFLVPETELSIIQADSTNLKFRGDINKDFSLDTVEYYLGSTNELSATQNPDDRFIYRKVNGLPANGAKIGVVTNFMFEYLDQDGNEVSTLISIKMIRINMKVENSAVYGNDPNPNKNKYRTAIWQQTRLVSRNLRR